MTSETLTAGRRVALDAAARWSAALLGAVALFSALLVSKGADPLAVFADVWSQTLTSTTSVQEILVKAGPIALAALAVALPARAGLTNVGGEGQLLLGAVAAAGTGLLLDQRVSGGPALAAMLVAGAVAGALWAGLAALLRLAVRVNEAVTTLLLNYVSLDVLLFLIYEPWKDPDGSGQPATRPLAEAARLPVFTGTGVHVGIALVVAAAVVVWAALRLTRWGYLLAAVGGNPEAARRAGLPVPVLLLSALCVGGALAGLGGAVHLTGVEYQLRPGILVTIGYVGFLASWLARHRPVPVLLASLALAAFAVAGDSLQIDAGLPAATVNVLTGLVLVAVLGWTGGRAARARGGAR